MPQPSTDRRTFLKKTAVGGVAAAGGLLIPQQLQSASMEWLEDDAFDSLSDEREDDAVVRDEAYWARIRSLYGLRRDVVNLDHGWTNPTPLTAIDELLKTARTLQGLPAEELPKLWETVSSTRLRGALASAMNVPPAEIALVRNATEALDTVLLGFPLKPGDEVVCSAHDYYAMLDALDQRRDRDGVVLRMIKPSIPASSMDAIEEMYSSAITDRTRLVLLTHPSNLTGQYLPVQRIADRAHSVGAEVVVDGAQSLGILEDPVRSLRCDYYGASAHKWLGTPVGVGVLWMKPEHTGKIWPLVPPMRNEKGMARFEWIGTCPEYINVASIPALALHSRIGTSRKKARLQYLASTLREQISKHVPDAKFYSSLPMGGTLTHIEIPGIDPAVAQKRIRERHSILIQGMTEIRSDSSIRSIRISPNVYTSLGEITRFVTALSTEMPALKRGSNAA